MSTERERVALLRALLEQEGGGVLLGIGDDAAVLAGAGAPLVVSVDAMVEGVHFKRAFFSFRELGYKSVMAAASDLAAMGARPRAVLAALTLTADVSDEELAELARGQAEACRALGAPLVGGNLARGGELAVATTVLGEASRPLRRDGARPGESLLLSGAVGRAGAGLELIARGRDEGRAAEDESIEAWVRPRARIAEGLRAAEAGASAAIDVSDGLALDAARLAEASGVRVVLEAEPLVDATLAAVAARIGLEPLELALHRGEDYALLVSAPAAVRIDGFRVVGRCEPLPPGEPPVLLREGGALRPVEPRGFDHFP